MYKLRKVSLDKLSYGEGQSFPLCSSAVHARNLKERRREGGREREEINVELEIKI